MANVSQIYQIVNSAAKQAMGSEAIAATDTRTLVSLGDAVLSSAENTDAFMHSLVDRIGRTIVSIRAYDGNFGGLVREPIDYGIIVQKLYVDVPEAQENPTWKIGETGFSPEFAPVNTPVAKQKIFNNVGTWEVGQTIPDFMLKTAFTGPTEMGVFISAIFTAMKTSMNKSIEDNVNLTRATFIAHKLKSNRALSSINLLASYNTLTNESLTVASAMRSPDFIRYVAEQISIWRERMRTLSVLFNEEGYKRHTPTDLLRVDILQDFAAAADVYLQADTYHNELTALPLYNRVPFWQGSGTGFSFSDTSSVKIKLSDTVTISESGVIAVLSDRDAMAVTVDNRQTTTERNNRAHYTTYYEQADVGYLSDLSENGMVFYLKEV